MSVAFNEALATKSNQASDAYRASAEASLRELLSVAETKIWNNLGDSDAPTAKAREISLSDLGDLSAQRPRVTVPGFTFNPEDYLPPDLLKKYNYESEFFDTFLEGELREIIVSDIYFLSQDIQDALFAQTRQRDLRNLNDELDASARQTAAQTGFPIPTTLLTGAQDAILRRYHDTVADRNNQITVLSADKALDARMRGIDAGIRMEDIRSRFQLAYGQLYFNAAEYLVRKYQADVQAEVSRVNADLEQLRLKAQIDLGMVSADTAWNNTLTDRIQLRLNRLIQDANNDLEVQKTQAKMQLDALTKIIDYYSDAAAAYVGQMNGVNVVNTSA